MLLDSVAPPAAVGVSNFGVAHLKELVDSPLTSVVPAANEVELHPFLRKDAIEEFCSERGIRLIAYSPLARAEVERRRVEGQLALRRLARVEEPAADRRDDVRLARELVHDNGAVVEDGLERVVRGGLERARDDCESATRDVLASSWDSIMGDHVKLTTPSNAGDTGQLILTGRGQVAIGTTGAAPQAQAGHGTSPTAPTAHRTAATGHGARGSGAGGHARPQAIGQPDCEDQCSAAGTPSRTVVRLVSRVSHRPRHDTHQSAGAVGSRIRKSSVSPSGMRPSAYSQPSPPIASELT